MKISLFRIVLMLLCITSIAVNAQEKVVENSGKKPKWIGTTMPETIIVTADAPDMMEARNKCMDLVKQEIVNSVAVNINSSSFSSKTQTSFNEHYALKTEYSSEIKTIAARLPFISGISVSDAETYWERIYVKKEKRYFYRFHLKYSYPEITKKKLIFEFEKNDEEKSLQLEKLKSEYNNIYSVEEIGSRIVELRALAEYFFDDVRKSETTLLIKQYNELYSQITVQTLNNTPGEYSCVLILKDKVVSCSKLPLLKSDYVTNLTVSRNVSDKSFTVKYDYKGCESDDPNTVEMVFHLGNKKMKHEFRFDISGYVADVKVTGFVNIFVKQKEEGILRYEVEMNLLAGSGSDFSINEISLQLNELNNPITIISEGNTVNQGKGHFKFSAISENLLTDKKGNLARGYIKLKNNKTGNMETVEFTRPYKLTVN